MRPLMLTRSTEFAIVSTGVGAASACGTRVTSTSTPLQAGSTFPTQVTASLVGLGDSLFNSGACQRCHGAKGVGAQNGPRLVAGPWLHHSGGLDEIIATVTQGVPRERPKDTTRRSPMNPRGGPMKLDDAGVRAVSAYVWSISREKR